MLLHRRFLRRIPGTYLGLYVEFYANRRYAIATISYLWDDSPLALER